MDTGQDYRRKAEEAERLAQRAKDPAEREAYERIAQGWRDLEKSAEFRKRRGF